VVVVSLLVSNVSSGGPYPPSSGPGATGVPVSDPQFVEWASGVADLTRGPQDISHPAAGLASVGVTANALGKADDNVVSLGDGGSATLTFDKPIANGAGPDFAVFENGFVSSGGLDYLELAFVEVSSDGVDFFRFPSVSLTQTTTQVASFGLLDPTNLYDLAGKDIALTGTPFDLDELAGVSPLLDVSNVKFVRMVDVVGSTNPLYVTHDSLGNIVNDPWPTAFTSSGFDLDAVGVLHAAPEPGTSFLAGVAGLLTAMRSLCGRNRSASKGERFVRTNDC
jgi:hypothetical protein